VVYYWTYRVRRAVTVVGNWQSVCDDDYRVSLISPVVDFCRIRRYEARRAYRPYRRISRLHTSQWQLAYNGFARFNERAWRFTPKSNRRNGAPYEFYRSDSVRGHVDLSKLHELGRGFPNRFMTPASSGTFNERATRTGRACRIIYNCDVAYGFWSGRLIYSLTRNSILPVVTSLPAMLFAFWVVVSKRFAASLHYRRGHDTSRRNRHNKNTTASFLLPTQTHTHRFGPWIDFRSYRQILVYNRVLVGSLFALEIYYGLLFLLSSDGLWNDVVSAKWHPAVMPFFYSCVFLSPFIRYYEVTGSYFSFGCTYRRANIAIRSAITNGLHERLLITFAIDFFSDVFIFFLFWGRVLFSNIFNVYIYIYLYLYIHVRLIVNIYERFILHRWGFV